MNSLLRSFRVASVRDRNGPTGRIHRRAAGVSERERQRGVCLAIRADQPLNALASTGSDRRQRLTRILRTL